MKNINLIPIAIFTLIFTFCGSGKNQGSNDNSTAESTTKHSITVPVFNQDSAYSFVKRQVDFGPRVPNTKAHNQCLEYLQEKLKSYGAEVIIQKGKGTLYNNQSIDIKNIVGSFNPTATHRVLLAAHWDSRPYADQDQDPSKHKTPILGANDGASGVGVLLEIARHLSKMPQNIGIDIVFFDVEDYGQPAFHKDRYSEDGGWCIGSKYWAQNPHIADYKANYGILLDMVGAPSAKFYKEQYSMQYAKGVVDKVWQKAIESGFEGYFINQRGGYIIDDHLPVNEVRKIPMIDIVHYDPNTDSGFNRHWHTVKDDMNNIDRNTLYAVGQTVMNVIFEY